VSVEPGDKPASYDFGHWRFDAATGDLSDGATTSRLEPQVARLLTYFLSHQNTLVTRDELVGPVWDGRIVSDDAVNRCISILRQKLTPGDRNLYIETVVRRGFISHFPPPADTPRSGSMHGIPGVPATPDASELAAEPGSIARKTGSRPGSGRRTAVVLATIAVVAIAAIWLARQGPAGAPPISSGAPATDAPMIAVLPFMSAGLSGEGDFFARGMHDDLLTQLAQFDSLRVISRTSVAEYRDVERNIRQIGRELGADAILEGSVQQVRDGIRINMQLIDAHTDAHLWAQRYDRELTPENIFRIQAEIARSVAAALNSTLTQRDRLQLDGLPTRNMAAYRAYHEAIELRDQVSIADPAYIAKMERAVALDPDFVRAWTELAGSLSLKNIRVKDPASIRRLEGMLERIRSLAPGSSEYLIAQAYYTYYVLNNEDVAYELVLRAQAMRPSDIQLMDLKSWIQRRQADYDGMITTLRQVLTLDPRSEFWTTRLVANLMMAHRYDEASTVLESTRVSSLRLAVLQSELDVRSHGDPTRLEQDLLALQLEYGKKVRPFKLWEAHIAARNYPAALAVIDAFQGSSLTPDAWSYINVPDSELTRLITLSLQQNSARGGGSAEGQLALPGAEYIVQEQTDELILARALSAAATGQRKETERLVRRWQREAAEDYAALANHRHYSCRALGMVNAVPATLACLRSALAEPSVLRPFIEPLLPYYDGMREDSRFQAFVAEREQG
jgi:TolB-like protein/DNA-binding winged helix-turn-helix (wHTH) protein